MSNWSFNPRAPLEEQTLLARFALAGMDYVEPILSEAEKKLGLEAPLDGYQRQHIEGRVRKQVEAIYEAIRGLRLNYRNQPWRSKVTQQQVRSPYTVLRRGHGCCIDLVLLLAAAVGGARLYPLIVVVGVDPMVPTHAVLGYWLEDNQKGPDPLTGTVLDEKEVLRFKKHKQLGFLDVTGVTVGREDRDFDAAEGLAQTVPSAEQGGWRVCYAVDVEACRRLGFEAFPEPEPAELKFRRWLMFALAYAVPLSFITLFLAIRSIPKPQPEHLIRGPIWQTSGIVLQELKTGSFLFTAAALGGEASNPTAYEVDARSVLRLQYSNLTNGILRIHVTRVQNNDSMGAPKEFDFQSGEGHEDIALSALAHSLPEGAKGKFKIGVKLLLIGGCSVQIEQLDLLRAK